MKILFTTSQIEYPPRSGPALRIESSIKALSQIAELVIVSQLPMHVIGGEEAVKYYSQYCSGFHFLLEKDPAKCSGIIMNAAFQEKVDVIWMGFGNVAYDIRLNMALQKCPWPVITDTDSVWSRFILRGLTCAETVEQKIKIFADGIIRRWEESWGTDLTEVTTAVSKVDMDYYRIFTKGTDKVQIFSNVIDLDRYAQYHPNPEIKKPCMYLAGTFWQSSPMEDAAVWVLDNVLPLVRAKIPDIHFYIIGKDVTQKVIQRADAGVTVTGSVPSVLPYLMNVDVALVPLRFESGTRFKIMEAGVCNIPIVSTTLGAEGIPVQHGRDIMIADTPAEFADSIVEVINNKPMAKEIASNCKQLISERCSVAYAVKEAESILNSLTKNNFRRLPVIDPSTASVAAQVHKAVYEKDIGSKFAYAISLLDIMLEQYANEPLFMMPEEVDAITEFLGEISAKVTNPKTINSAVSRLNSIKALQGSCV